MILLWAYFCMAMAAIVGFSNMLPSLTIPMIFLIFVGGLFLLGSWFFKSRKVAKTATVTILGATLVAVCGCSIAYWIDWQTRSRYDVVRANINEWDYRPFRKGNKLIVPENLTPERLAGTLPKLSGAYALYPVYAAVAQALYPHPENSGYYIWEFVDTTGSDRTFQMLNRGNADLIFGGAPSEAQLEVAQKAGIQYEMTPFGREAFVFFVNKENPINNLSSEQIRGIYSGKIKDWKEIGAPESEEIIAFQRNKGSGSQTMLEKIMAGTPIAPPIEERVSDGMGTILTQTAEYRNKNSAIGFSFRFYTLEMMHNDKLKLLSIDGIAPTKENIVNGTYPFIADFYMISAQPRSENTKKIVEFMFSPAGQEIIEKTGYIPLPKSNPIEK
ncbi:MAG: substrate-binding domain-containing protein [Opitutales bacterium]|nr:substrate-binding domain-containing protein [Opitutales bacterium]